MGKNTFVCCSPEEISNYLSGNEFVFIKPQTPLKIKSSSFLKNPSIWIRMEETDAEKGVETQTDAQAEFDYFDKIGLYDWESSKVSLEYNKRIQKENKFSPVSHYNNHFTPIMYGDEVAAKERLQKNYIIPENPQESKNPDFKFLKDYHDIAFRILLIDNRVHKGEDDTDRYTTLEDLKKLEIKKCEGGNCSDCPHLKNCKLGIIKLLMDDGAEDKGLKSKNFDEIGTGKDYFYWNASNIETYYCPTVLKDFIDDTTVSQGAETEINVYSSAYGEQPKKESSVIDVECSFAPQISQINTDSNDEKNKLNVQIIGVRDVRTALLLMSKYKFDMIFCDYLLDKKDKNKDERDFSKQLFEFLSHDYKKDIENAGFKFDEEPSTQEEKKKWARLKLLHQLRREVLDNRGPLGKFWIMPITEFNQTFIQDLYSISRINLIDNKWNISKSADPITTPWQFLDHLNQFIELQLRSCVFTMDKLLTFLLYTCQDLETLFENNANNIKFDDFQSFIGSEYATLMHLYGNSLPIKRDAQIGNTSPYKSVFATYIWKNFYANKKFVNEIELYRLMHRFYHQAAVMYNDRNGCQRLNEAFEHLCFFIRTNIIVRQKLDEEFKELKEKTKGLSFLKEVIEKCTR